MLTLADRETRDDGLLNGELLAAAEVVPPTPFTRVPLKSENAPADAVGPGGDGVAERVDVAVALALPVAVLVAVHVALDDALALGEREESGDFDTLSEALADAVNVPTVPLKNVPSTSNAEPGVIVATADGVLTANALAADERETVAAAEMLGVPAADAVGVPCDPLYKLPLT